MYKILAAIISFSLIVFFVDFLLSFSGLEEYDKEFSPRSSYPFFVQGQGELKQYYVTNPHFSNSINNQIFPIKKEKGVTRIFVVGSSAAFAWPFTEEFGFTGYLRRVLDHFAPGKFEIINAAGMSFGSHRVYDVLKDVVKLEPDLVLVYSGNNEYVERNVIAQPRQKNRALELAGELLSQTHIYRAVRLGMFYLAPSVFHRQTGPDLTDLRADSVVSRGALGRSSEIDREVLSNLRTNISEIRNLLLANHIKGIFFTTPSNVTGYQPTSPPLRFTDKNDPPRWHQLQAQVIDAIRLHDSTEDQAAKVQHLHHAEELLAEMSRITPNDPWILFALGQIHLLLDERDRAYAEFVQAKDLDARPIRELSTFNDAVRSIASEKSDDSELVLFDLEELLANEIRRGNDNWIFLDYCHFTDAGHKFIAINLLPVILNAVGKDYDTNQMALWIFNDDWKKNKNQNILNNVLYASGSTHIHNGQYRDAEEDFLKILAALGPEASGTYASSVYRALSYVYEGMGNKKLYKEYLLKAIESNPVNYEALISGGYLFLDEGNLARSEEMLEQALRINQYSPMVLEGLGRIALMKGSAQEAILRYEGSLALGGDNFLLRKELGNAYLAMGDVDKAVRSWQEALAFEPADREVSELIIKFSRQ